MNYACISVKILLDNWLNFYYAYQSIEVTPLNSATEIIADDKEYTYQ